MNRLRCSLITLLVLLIGAPAISAQQPTNADPIPLAPPALLGAVENASGQFRLNLVNTDETATNGLFTISDDLVQANLESLKQSDLDLSADDIFDLSLLDEVYAENPDLKG